MAWHSEAVQKAADMTRSICHLLNRQLGLGWSTWCTLRADRLRKLAALHRGLAYLLQRQLTLGFVSWHSQWSRHNQKRDAMERALCHMLNREQSRCWVAWQGQLRRSHESMQLLRSALALLLHRSLARALHKWANRAAVGMRAVALPERKPTAQQLYRVPWMHWLRYAMAQLQVSDMRNLFLRWHRDRIIVCWDRWRRHYSSLAQRRAHQRRALRHMLRRELSRAFNSMVVNAGDRAQKRRLMRRASAHMRQGRLGPAWRSWSMQSSAGRRAKGRQLRVQHFLRWSGLARGLSIWMSRCTGEAGRDRLLLRRSISHLRNRGLSHGWHAWRTHCEIRIFARRLLSRGRAYCNLRWRGWRMWHKACRFQSDKRRAQVFRRWCSRQRAHEAAVANAFAAASALLPIPTQSTSPPIVARSPITRPPLVYGTIVGEESQHLPSDEDSFDERRASRGARNERVDRAERIAEMAASAAENAAAAALMLAGRTSQPRVDEPRRHSPAVRVVNRAIVGRTSDDSSDDSDDDETRHQRTQVPLRSSALVTRASPLAAGLAAAASGRPVSSSKYGAAAQRPATRPRMRFH